MSARANATRGHTRNEDLQVRSVFLLLIIRVARRTTLIIQVLPISKYLTFG